jgi:hypothetical protein
VIERLAEELHIEPLDLLQEGDTAARPMLRAAASGEPGSVPDARSLPTGRRPRPPA